MLVRAVADVHEAIVLVVVAAAVAVNSFSINERVCVCQLLYEEVVETLDEQIFVSVVPGLPPERLM